MLEPDASRAIEATFGVAMITAAPAAAPAVPWRNARRLVPSSTPASGTPLTAGTRVGTPIRILGNKRRFRFAIVRLLSLSGMEAIHGWVTLLVNVTE
jgi:hypothetical protein